MDISDVDICNSALAMAGQDLAVMSLTGMDSVTRKCRLYYPQALNLMLVAVDHVCAGSRKKLNKIDPAPDFGFLYQYQLPTNPACLKVRKAILDTKDMSYEIEGDKLLTDSEDCCIKYTFRLTDTTRFSPVLIEMVKYQLASYLAKAISEDNSLSLKLREELNMVVIPEAERFNAGQCYQEGEDGQDSWLDT